MKFISKLIRLKFLVLINLFFFNISFADNHNIYETLDAIKNDLTYTYSKVNDGMCIGCNAVSKKSNYAS